jgi:type II secretory pathway component GspD/PulD (secretin)
VFAFPSIFSSSARSGAAIASTAALVLCAAPFSAQAQEQPPRANNNQDEQININRNARQETEVFSILRSGDKQEVTRYVAKAYPLRHAHPYEIRPYLRTAAALEKGSVITAWMPPGTESAGNQWIQVNVPEYQLPFIDQLVAAYDVPGFVSVLGDVKFSYRLKHRRASEVADFIRASTLTPDGLIRSDDTTNTVYVQESPSDFVRVLAQIQFYDIPAPQVAVKVKIVELNELDNTKLGLDWDAWKVALAGSFTGTYDNIRDAIAATPEISGRAYTSSSLVSIEATVLARFLNYLEDQGKARTLVATRLNVSNGQVALLRSGTEVPEFNLVINPAAGTHDLTEAGRPASGLASLGEGLAISVAPMVAAETTRLDCRVALRSPAGVDALGHPIYSEQELVSNLSVDQKRVYSLGSMRRSSYAKQRKGIPLLKSIPVVKYLFSVETTIKRESELFVFISPEWSAPRLPRANAMKNAGPLDAEAIEGILSDNPNLGMSPEDQRILEAYFEGMELKRDENKP